MFVAVVVVEVLVLAAVVAVVVRTRQQRRDALREVRSLNLAVDRAKMTVVEAEERLGQAEDQAREAERRADAADAGRDEAMQLVAEIEAAATEAAGAFEAVGERARAAEARVADLEQQLAAAEARAAEAVAKVVAAEARADHVEAALGEAARQPVTAALPLAGVASIDEATGNLLWTLETARVNRVWETSVSVGPAATSPVGRSANVALDALEIDAAAVREDAGTEVEVRWDGPPPATVLGTALVVRTGAELLAAAAKTAESAVLSVEVDDDGGIALRIEGLDADDQPVAVAPPSLEELRVDGAYRLPG